MLIALVHASALVRSTDDLRGIWNTTEAIHHLELLNISYARQDLFKRNDQFSDAQRLHAVGGPATCGVRGPEGSNLFENASVLPGAMSSWEGFEIVLDLGIFVITVTYGDRYFLLSRVLERVKNEGVKRIIVVCNNPAQESRCHLAALASRLAPLVDVIDLPTNQGAAAGFGEGMRRAASDPACTHMWLLDDDNLPEPGALSVLCQFWQTLDEPDKDRYVCLASNRSGAYYEEAVASSCPDLVIGPPNSFWGLHFVCIPYKLMKRLQGKKLVEESGRRYGPVSTLPFGGLFLPKQVVDIFGYPRTDYLLYVDDYEYTLRISRGGGRILLLLDSKVKDIEGTWESGDRGFHFLRLAFSSSPIRLYYSTRNWVRFHLENTVTNVAVFLVNLIAFTLLFVFAATACRRFGNIVTYVGGVLAGLRNESGMVSRYPLPQGAMRGDRVVTLVMDVTP